MNATRRTCYARLRVSTSVDEIARSSEEAAEAIEHSDRGSKAIGELLTTLKAKTSQFRV